RVYCRRLFFHHSVEGFRKLLSTTLIFQIHLDQEPHIFCRTKRYNPHGERSILYYTVYLNFVKLYSISAFLKCRASSLIKTFYYAPIGITYKGKYFIT